MAKIGSERELFALGHRALGISGTALAKLLGVSSKTITRWHGGQSSISAFPIGDMAPHVYAKDPALATRMRAYAAAELAAANHPPPPPLPIPVAPEAPAPAAAPVSNRLQVTGVVYAACEAMNAGPAAAKPVVLAAFRAARELGLSLDDVLRELAPVKAEKPKT